MERAVPVFKVCKTDLRADSELLQLAKAPSLLGSCLCLSKDREEDGRQDRNDSDHDEHFNEGEGALPHDFLS